MQTSSFIHQGRLRRLQIFRLLLITLLLGALLIFEFVWPQETSRIPTSIYCYVAFTYLVTIIYAVRLKKVAKPRGFIYRQLLADATLIAVLLSLTGGFYSLFFPLFYIIILGGAIYLQRQQVISLLFYCTFLYLLVVFFHVHNPLPGIVHLQPLDSNRKIVSHLFFNLAPFYLTAFILQLIAEERLDTLQRLQKVTSDLKDFRDLNQHIISSIDSGLITTDQRLVINSINQAGRAILRLKPEEVLYRPLPEVLSLSLPAPESGAPPRKKRFETVYHTPDGKRRVLGFSLTPLKKNNRRNLGWILIFQDLSEAKEIEQRLQEARKMAAIGRLAAGFAHEIRNPLAAITGSIEILGRDLPQEDETHHRLMRIVLRESTRMNHLISDFLSFSRQENRKQTETDLLSQLRDTVFIFRSQFPQITFREHYHRESFSILANPEQLEQIFWNLLKNATEALADHGEISITSRAVSNLNPLPNSADTSSPGSGIEIEIRDDGPGIEQEIVDKIFEPFFTTKDNGTGLGLYIVFQLTRINHGTIEIDRPSPGGRGTRVCLRFPAAGQLPASEKKSRDES